ncbi:hypothetical protein M0R45_013597 [Rubus argutus]|uniref:Uncharacterized protein n=1 Tax=Rubus argutus TaxID=59490 RepID=A0AAW1XJL6_RUBAR
MAGEGDIEKGEVNASVQVLVPRPVEQWERALLRHDSPMPSTCCIFRVPEVLRRQDILAYEPDIVSIGPFHRGVKKQFQLTENVKKWYLTCVLERLNKSMESLIDSVIKDLEIPAIRGCYADTLDLDQNSFVEMLILDGCFLVEFFRKAPYPDDKMRTTPFSMCLVRSNIYTMIFCY